MALKSVYQVTKTDNKSVANKVFLRRKATEHLDEIKVLDLFAGKNVLLICIDKIRHCGVELLPGKGANLTADAKRAVRSLDLSQFNVIDCDSYGIPFEICKYLLESSSVKSGTVIIYTAIITDILSSHDIKRRVADIAIIMNPGEWQRSTVLMPVIYT